jgi:ADP-ribose pyrophosphatase
MLNTMESDDELLCAGEHLHFVRRGTWEFVRQKQNKHGVMVIALTDDDNLVLVEQDRPPVGGRTIELPSGSIDKTLREAAEQEMLEETRYRFKDLTVLAHGPTSPGMTSDTNEVCIVRGLSQSDPNIRKESRDHGSRRYMVEGTEYENTITVWEVPLDRIMEWLHDDQRRPAVVDLRVYAGLFFLFQKRSEPIGSQGAPGHLG